MQRQKPKYEERYFAKITEKTKQNKTHQAISMYEQYLKQYPNDVRAWAYYIDSLIRIGLFDKAEYAVDDAKIKRYSNKLDQKCLIIEKIKLLCYKGDYEKVLDIIYKNKNLQIDQDIMIKYIMAYINTQLNIPLDTKDEQDTYMYSQIVNYDQTLFMNENKMYTDNQENEVRFNPSFSLSDFCSKITDYFTPEKRMYLNGYDNQYFFKYPNCGVVKGKQANYIKVLTIDNTENIFRVTPTTNVGTLPIIELEEQPENGIKKKIIIPSQIDKFNKRYKI